MVRAGRAAVGYKLSELKQRRKADMETRTSIMDEWEVELKWALTRVALAQRPLLRPRIIKLPSWLTSGYGAWTLFHIVAITEQQASCPSQVRRYIIGHELGHLCGGHYLLQYFWVFAEIIFLLGAALASAAALFGILLICIASIGFMHPGWILEREVFADRVAADLFGTREVITASLWMSYQVGDFHTRGRQARLRKLRSYLPSTL